MNDTKILKGQFYTIKDPFNKSEAFLRWWELCPKDSPILEPFAGAGNLFSYIDAEWVGFDIEPGAINIRRRDTIKRFPKGYRTCITNPPYLAKNSISRNHHNINTKYEDLYLDCLRLCLENCQFVAAIIPSTFWSIEDNFFFNRLFAWDKIDYKMFSDTDTPVGVGYWIPEYMEAPESRRDTRIYVNGKELLFNRKYLEPAASTSKIKFNVHNGTLVLSCIDTTKKENIRVCKKDESFNEERFLKDSSRNFSLIRADSISLDDLEPINSLITKWRTDTSDFYLTSFKSLMQTGKYRKRIGFDQFRWIVQLYKQKNMLEF